MTDEITWVKGHNGMIPFNIQTQAGREIWTEINMKGGSGYWGPLGKALPLVEAEAMRMAEERIIALLEADIAKCDWKEVAKDILSDEPCEECDQTRHLIELIKEENE